VIETYVGDGREDRLEDIGGVETPPQAGFDDRDLYFGAGEMIKRERCD